MPVAATPSLPSLPTPPPRPADQVAEWAGRVSTVVDIPVVAIEAYGWAAVLMGRDDPGCHLAWTTLAGIGEVESNHGQRNGAQLLPNGRSKPEIVGPQLDGKNGNPLVPDTDAGAYDGDPTYDRAMGPLQLLPTVWAVYAADADGDGILDPYDIDDASLALARMLCAGTEDLNQLPGWTAAIGRLHPGETYANAVFTAADHYGQLSRSIK
jgi:membrane-bound lytic murein transglycosylase B